MEKKTQIVPEKIHIKSISVYKSNIEVSEELLDLDPNIDGYSFSFAQDSGFNLEEKHVRLRLSILVRAKDQDNNLLDIKGEFGIEYIFFIENIDDFRRGKGDNSDKLSSILGSTLSAIAYSTARGLVLNETESTILGGIVLPVIDPYTLLDNVE